MKSVLKSGRRMPVVVPVVVAGCVAAVVLSGCGAPEGPTTATAPTNSSTTAGLVTSTTRPTQTPTAPAGASAVATGKSGRPRGLSFDAAKVDVKSATNVAQAFAVTSYTLDARLDMSPNDGPRRGLGWVSPRLRAALAGPLPGDGGAPWRALVAADGFTRVSVVEEEAEVVESGNSTSRREHLTVTSLDGRGKQIGQPERFVVIYDLVRAGSGQSWFVSGIRAS